MEETRWEGDLAMGNDEKAAKDFLREKGPQVLEQIRESLRNDSLTPEERQKLETTASMLAGRIMSFWLPTTPLRKVFMFLFLIIGTLGTVWWSPWFALLMLLGCSFSPRISAEVLRFIGKLSN